MNFDKPTVTTPDVPDSQHPDLNLIAQNSIDGKGDNSALAGTDIIDGPIQLGTDHQGRTFFKVDKDGKLPDMPQGVHYHPILNLDGGDSDMNYVTVDPGAKLPQAPLGHRWDTDGAGAWYLRDPNVLPIQPL